MMSSVTETVKASTPALRGRRIVLIGLACVIGVAVATFVVHQFGGADEFTLFDGSAGAWAYVLAFLLVVADAICPVFPGETTLNAASTLASQGKLALGWVIVAGALGAIVGDSALYWLARRSSRRFGPQVEKAKENSKVSAALSFLGSSAPVMLVVGRYVPGLRFVVNATLGLTLYPYRRFLLWSSIGGTLWSIYTCTLAYAVGTALSDFPLASVIISGAITTIAIAILFFVIRHRRHTSSVGTVSPPSAPGAG
jgi:membrane protein DedA with SNARE-associated domain